MHQQSQKVVGNDERFSIVNTLNVSPMVEGVKMMSDVARRAADATGRMYLGSIDGLTAVNWAKECGHPLYSRAWREYARKKLMSNEFSHFKADVTRRYG